MKVTKLLTLGLITLLGSVFALSNYAYAVTLSVEPNKVQRAINGKARVLIYANDASALISMGIKVSFNPATLQVDSANTAKYVDFNNGFVMDADGNSATTNDQYTTPTIEVDNGNGSVTMIGGRLIGTATNGLNGKVLLGWIVFNCVGNGVANITVDLAKYHPSHPTQRFDNFVNLNGTVDEPTNANTVLGWIYVGDNACEGNLNADARVNVSDLNLLKAEFGRNDCSQPGKNCVGDINVDGRVNVADLNLLKAEFGRNDCPSFP